MPTVHTVRPKVVPLSAGQWATPDPGHYTISPDGQTVTDRGAATVHMDSTTLVAGSTSGTFTITQVGNDQSGGGYYTYSVTDAARSNSTAPTPNVVHNSSSTYTLTVNLATGAKYIQLFNGFGIVVAEYTLT